MEKNQKRLTHNLDAPGNPSWSPDGQRIAFDVVKDGNVEICIMDSGGKNVERLSDNAATDMAPAWSPDGNTIAFERVGGKLNSEIHLLTPDGKSLKRLSHPNHNDVHPDWFDPGAWAISPIGNKITIWGSLRKLAPNLR